MPTKRQQQVIDTMKLYGGNVSRTASELGISRSSVYNHLRRAEQALPEMRGQNEPRTATESDLPPEGEVKRYILSSAQNNTKPNGVVWKNLLAMAEHYSAEILIGSLAYDLGSYGGNAVKGRAKQNEGPKWHPDLAPYIVDERIQLAPGLIWCGETNIIPTAKRPLSGMETYTQRSSGIFPHTKFAMESIASGKHEPTKFNYTTGAVTRRNYIQKKAGQQAEFHHGYGGLLVEVDHEGNWWVRQLNASKNGIIYDLDVVAKNGEVQKHSGVEAVTWGDIHELMLQDDQREVMHNITKALTPRSQFIHDVLLGSVINHWERDNPHEKVRRRVLGEGFSSLEKELGSAAGFLESMLATGSKIFVVDSNHDRPWLERWLRDSRNSSDATNALLWHRLNAAMISSIESNPLDPGAFHVLEHALQSLHGLSKDVVFLREDESHTITSAKIECGMHGHLGPNGARATPTSLMKLGHKANTGHTHSAGIHDGLYIAGTACASDMIYNKGPSSWSHSHIVTYPNGKRAIITVWNGRWRA